MTLRITGGTHRGRRVRVLGGAGLRPTSDRVRGAIFSVLGPDALEDARVLDLYAGTGIMGMEALSRGAAWADFIEADARRCRRIREALTELSAADSGRVYQGRVEVLIDTLSGDYDLALADPPYELVEWGGFMTPLGRAARMAEGGVVVVEHRHTTEPAKDYGRLGLTESRRYGDTSVSIYRVGAVID